MRREMGHHLGPEPLDLFQDDFLAGPHYRAYIDLLQAGVLGLDILNLLLDHFRGTDQPLTGFDRLLDGGQASGTGALGVAKGINLFRA